MSFRRLSLLTLATVLSACTARLPDLPANGGGASGGSSSPKPRPSVDAVKPTGQTGGGTPVAEKTPGGLRAVLKAPAGGGQTLAGSVVIDAQYATKVGGAKLIGPDGAGLIGLDGAAAVYVGAGLIGLDGAGLIGPDGAGLVALGGGNLIGKRKLSLMQAACGPARQLPAAAMEVQVRAMATGEALPVGVDTDGKPVYSIYTNAKGEYTVHLPPSFTGKNVLVEAGVPGTKDARLVYDALVNPKLDKSLLLDEDTAMASDYLRVAFVSRIEKEILLEARGMNGSEQQELDKLGFGKEQFDRLRKGVADSGIGKLPDDQRRRRAIGVGDALLAYVALDELKDPRSNDRALAVLGQLMTRVRREAECKMASKPDYFERQPFLLRANARLAPGTPPYTIVRASDFADFILRDVLSKPGVDNSTSREMEEALRTVFDKDPAQVADIVQHLNEVMHLLVTQCMLVMLSEPAALDAAITAMKREPVAD